MPWETPDVTGAVEVCLPSNTICWLRLARKLLIQVRVLLTGATLAKTVLFVRQDVVVV